jgi:Ca2+-binding RTX toxin-like protein
MLHVSRHAVACAVVTALMSAPLTSAALAGGAEPGEVFRGTARADHHVGTKYSDVLFGRGGADALQGRRGMDMVWGGRGWDLLSSGLRSDIVFGGPGRDSITGGDASDLVLEAGADDLVNGGAGRDWVYVGTGSDVIQAGAGADFLVLFGDHDPDAVQCGAGRDIAVYLRAHDALDRYRGCEQQYSEARFEQLLEDGTIEFPPVPPILLVEIDGLRTGVNSATSRGRAAAAFKAAYRWSTRKLLASVN